MVSKISTDTKIVVALFAVLFSFFLLVISGTLYSFDGMLMFQQARTLVGQHTLIFPEPIRWGAFYATSKYGIGMTLAYVPALLPWTLIHPAYFTANYFDSSIPYNDTLLQNPLYLYASWVNPLISALLGAVLYGLQRQLGSSQRWSLFGVLIVAVASPVAVYARFDYSQPLEALVLCAALLLVLRALGSRQYRYWVLTGICLGYGFLTRSDFVLVAGWVYLLCLFSDGTANAKPKFTLQHLKGMGVMTIPFGVGILLYLLVNELRYGSPFIFGYDGAFTHPGWFTGWVGVLVSPGTGLFIFFPLAILGIVTLVQLARQKNVVALVMGGLCITFWLFFGMWDEWWGGWSWGPRFLVPVIPLLTLYAVQWLSRSSSLSYGRIAVFGGLTTVGFIAAVNGMLFNFLFFYRNYYAGLQESNLIAEHFSFVASPLFAGWDWMQTLHPLDLWWVQNWIWSTTASRYGFVPLLMILGFGLVFLLRFLDKPEPAEHHEQTRVQALS